MNWLRRIFAQQSFVDDEPSEQQRKVALELFRDLREISQEVSDDPPTNPLFEESDDFPGGNGPFGLCASNPIPVNGVEGEIVYLERLRTTNGQRVFFQRIGSVQTPNQLPAAVDEYEVLALDRSMGCRLFFSMYFPRRSRKAPQGFTLVPWSRMSPEEQLMAKVGTTGCNTIVPNFPFGLVEAVRQRAKGLGLSDRVAGALTLRVRKAIEQLPERGS